MTPTTVSEATPPPATLVLQHLKVEYPDQYAIEPDQIVLKRPHYTWQDQELTSAPQQKSSVIYEQPVPRSQSQVRFQAPLVNQHHVFGLRDSRSRYRR